MPMFSLEDPVGLVKRFEVGEYRNNKLPIIYEKTRNIKNPINGYQTFAMSIKVEKGGKLFDFMEFAVDEVFGDE